MNAENFISLCAQLSVAGFDGLEYRLLQHICCRPVSFSLIEKREFGTDLLRCQIYFERKSNQYTCTYYDASLVREHRMPTYTINEIVLNELEAAMQEIDWLQGSAQSNFRINDETTWQREKAIDEIIGKLARLSATEDGKIYADTLKVRFWSGTLMEQLLGSLSPVRAKLEAIQRFYFVNGAGISVTEAYRFMQNRWLEKVFQKRKKSDSDEGHDDEASGNNGNEISMREKQTGKRKIKKAVRKLK